MPASHELGGPAYLVRLAGAAISLFAARDYAQLVYDLAIRRELILLGQGIADKAARAEVDSEPKDQIVEAEQALYQLGEQGKVDRGFQSFRTAVIDAVKVANAAYSATAASPASRRPRRPRPAARRPAPVRPRDPRRPPVDGQDRARHQHRLQHRPRLPPGHPARRQRRRGQGGVVGFFSLEMSAEQLATRVLSEASRVPSHQIRHGDMTEEEMRRFIEAAKASRTARSSSTTPRRCRSPPSPPAPAA